jgi:hypothetical protein
MKHIKLFEDLPSMWDPTYANPVFKIRYRSNNDLSNKKAPDTIDKPVNDVLDGIEVGDVVTGRGIDDENEHTGNVVRVQKDEKGENVKIEIEEEGEVIGLSPGSVKFAERGDKGNRAGIKGEPADTGNIDYTFGGYDNFAPTTYESVKSLKNLKSFNEF